ncbi:MAG: hypothetical protein MZV70_32980 [Desulfobacterales bacterium]|nr:hypothetical protein [Desulfobacterales bacterium]
MTRTQRPSGATIGWLPADERSRMDSRAWARPIPSPAHTPFPSGSAMGEPAGHFLQNLHRPATCVSAYPAHATAIEN